MFHKITYCMKLILREFLKSHLTFFTLKIIFQCQFIYYVNVNNGESNQII